MSTQISIRGGAAGRHSTTHDVASGHQAAECGAAVVQAFYLKNTAPPDVSIHPSAITQAAPDINNRWANIHVPTLDVQSALSPSISHAPRLSYPQLTHTTASALLRTHQSAYQSAPDYLKHTTRTPTSAQRLLRHGARAAAAGVLLRQVVKLKYQHAVRPLNWVVEAKRFEEISFNPCAVPPPSYQLPFKLIAQKAPQSALMALDLVCRENKKAKTNPSNPKPPINPSVPVNPNPTLLPTSGAGVFGTYTAASGETKRFELLTLSITTDIESFCWQANFAVSEYDYFALDLDGYAAGDEPVLSLWINGLRFDVLAEDWSDTRRFIANSYQITGRSITARLSKDYAKALWKEVNEPRTAKQIAEDALDNTPYQIERWEMVDWLIPTHQISEQTPIETISDMAQAAGAFVWSHRFEAKLSTKALWGGEDEAGVWRNKKPTVSIEDTQILSITGKRRVSEQYRGVYVVGSGANGRGALVYRAGTDARPEAPTLSHRFFTDDAPMRQAGIKALSDSGTHKMETVVLPFITGVPLAELGDTWQFGERGKTWSGVIKGITLDCSLDNDALFVTQTLEIDRYLGD